MAGVDKSRISNKCSGFREYRAFKAACGNMAKCESKSGSYATSHPSPGNRRVHWRLDVYQDINSWTNTQTTPRPESTPLEAPFNQVGRTEQNRNPCNKFFFCLPACPPRLNLQPRKKRKDGVKQADSRIVKGRISYEDYLVWNWIENPCGAMIHVQFLVLSLPIECTNPYCTTQQSISQYLIVLPIAAVTNPSPSSSPQRPS